MSAKECLSVTCIYCRESFMSARGVPLSRKPEYDRLAAQTKQDVEDARLRCVDGHLHVVAATWSPFVPGALP